MKFDSRRSNVRARNGMVATSQPLAAMAGLRMLMNGGTAVDAAVAAAAALNVVEPFSTGVGGDVFALVWSERAGKVYALNASGRSAAAADVELLQSTGYTGIPNDSPYAVTVPGAVSGWQALLERFGNMGMADVLRPAIDYAERRISGVGDGRVPVGGGGIAAEAAFQRRRIAAERQGASCG